MILVLLYIILRFQLVDVGQEDNIYKSAVSINVSNVGVGNFVKLFTAATCYDTYLLTYLLHGAEPLLKS